MKTVNNKKATRIYIVESNFSRREIIARSKKEAKEMFKQQLKGFITDNDRITVK
jgi:predicted type IV restriction endonuclease